MTRTPPCFKSGSKLKVAEPELLDKFRTILSLHQLIQKNYLIDNNLKRPSRDHASELLRKLVALSTVLVRNNEVVAVTVADEASLSMIDSDLSLIASAQEELDSDNPATVNFIASKNPWYQEKVKVYTITEPKIHHNGNALPYLLKNWRKKQSFPEHLAFVSKFINQKDEPGAWNEFQAYVTLQCVEKMERRFRARKHKLIGQSIVEVEARHLEWPNITSRKPTSHDSTFLKMLKNHVGQRILGIIMLDLKEFRRSGSVFADPSHNRILSELDSYQPQTVEDLFPNLMRVVSQNQYCLSQETYREFHQLLCLLILGYKDSLQQLIKVKSETKAPSEASLRLETLRVLCYLLLLHPLAYSEMITKYFYMVASARHRNVTGVPVGQGVGGGPANAVDDMETGENTRGAKEAGEDVNDGDDAVGNFKGPKLSVVDGGGADDDGAGGAVDGGDDDDDDRDGDGDDDDDNDDDDDDDNDNDDNNDDDDESDTDILDVSDAFAGEVYGVWLKLQVAHFDAMLTLQDLPKGTNVVIKHLSTPLVRRKIAPWRLVVEEVMSDSASSPLGVNTDATAVIQMLEASARDNSNLREGLEKLTLSREDQTTSLPTHCEANLIALMFLSEEDLQSNKDLIRFSWKDIQYLKGFASAVGVSKRLCPTCAVLAQRSFQDLGNIEVPGSHGQVTACALPPWLPEHVVKEMVSKFASDLRTILPRLGNMPRLRSNSVTSVDTDPPSDDEFKNRDLMDNTANMIQKISEFTSHSQRRD